MDDACGLLAWVAADAVTAATAAATAATATAACAHAPVEMSSGFQFFDVETRVA